MSLIISILGIIGLIISLYAWRIVRLSKNKKYKPFCDVNKTINCSKVLNSKYGKIFGLPNVVWGIPFFITIIALSGLNFLPSIILLSFLAVLVSIYLALAQIFELKKVCIVCWTVYSINVALLITSYLAVYVIIIP